MQRIKINDDSTNNGIEAYYYPEYKTLYIEPTNSKQDWVENFTGWLFPKSASGRIVNRKWWAEVQALYELIKDLEIETLIGYSKGGAQAWYLQTLIPAKVISVAGFPPWFSGKLPGKLYKKRGDIVPLFSGVRHYEKVIHEYWQPFWKAHIWTTTEIESIIKENYLLSVQ